MAFLPAPISANPTVDANGAASSTSLAIIEPVPSSNGIDRAADAGLFILLSPKVIKKTSAFDQEKKTSAYPLCLT